MEGGHCHLREVVTQLGAELPLELLTEIDILCLERKPELTGALRSELHNRRIELDLRVVATIVAVRRP